MRFSLNLLREILSDAKFVGFTGDEYFTFLNIAKPTGLLSRKIDESNVLFFPVYAKDVDIDGWYDNSFDRREYLKEVSEKNPHWVFVVDPLCLNIEGKKIIVSDIFKAITEIYEYVLDIVKPIVVAVTGSVGKTTTVAMLEDAISTECSCLRIYSKRITPLILWSSIINFLDEKIDVIVLEMSFYRKHHIEWMAKALSPDISVILNIMENHIGVDGVDIDQIVEAKSRIITDKSLPVINADDQRLRKIIHRHKSGVLFSAKNPKCKIFGTMRRELARIFVRDSKFTVVPFLATRLTLYQTMAVFAVCFSLGLDLDLVSIAINNFEPKEKRISKKKIKGREVIFDAEVSGPSRMLQLADNEYKKSVLLVHEFGFGIDPIEPKIKGILDAFKKFYFVRISNKANIPFILKQAIDEKKLKNVLFVESDNIMEDIPFDAIIFYHYGEYFRRKKLEFL